MPCDSFCCLLYMTLEAAKCWPREQICVAPSEALIDLPPLLGVSWPGGIVPEVPHNHRKFFIVIGARPTAPSRFHHALECCRKHQSCLSDGCRATTKAQQTDEIRALVPTRVSLTIAAERTDHLLWRSERGLSQGKACALEKPKAQDSILSELGDYHVSDRARIVCYRMDHQPDFGHGDPQCV